MPEAEREKRSIKVTTISRETRAADLLGESDAHVGHGQMPGVGVARGQLGEDGVWPTGDPHPIIVSLLPGGQELAVEHLSFATKLCKKASALRSGTVGHLGPRVGSLLVNFSLRNAPDNARGRQWASNAPEQRDALSRVKR